MLECESRLHVIPPANRRYDVFSRFYEMFSCSAFLFMNQKQPLQFICELIYFVFVTQTSLIQDLETSFGLRDDVNVRLVSHI